MTQKPTSEPWGEEFYNLPAINYNLYYGSGPDAGKNALTNTEAEEQIIAFIRQEKAKSRAEGKEELLAEMAHEGKKFVDGFSHDTKNCLVCTTEKRILASMSDE